MAAKTISSRLGLILRIITASFLLLVIMVSIALAEHTTKPVMASHRAVYDLKFSDSQDDSSVIGVRGRIVFEMRGSSCEGYTVNMRIVTGLDYKDGKSTLTDTVMRNWEGFDGNSYIFENISRTNGKITENTRGRAIRESDGSMSITLSKPKSKKAKLPDDTSFPTDHLKSLIATGMKNDMSFIRKLFDGSEDGKTPFDTSAFIGKRIAPDASNVKAGMTDLDKLRRMGSWPVTLSYFKKDVRGEGVPDYEVSFRLFENGVSTDLKFDYGDFTMTGPLKSFELLKETSCD